MDSNSHVFKTLKQNILKLKRQKQQVSTELLSDRKDLHTIQLSIQQLTTQVELKLTKLKAEEQRIADIERTISETEKSYDIIVQTTQKLAMALEQESSHLKSKIRK